MMVIVVLLVVVVLVVVGLLLSVLRSRRNLFVMLRDTRLERDRAETRVRIHEQACAELHEDYAALAKECEALRERANVAESKLSRKGCGAKGSKKQS